MSGNGSKVARRARQSLGVLALLAAGWAQAAGISDGVVKIGVLTDMSGVSADNSGKGSVAAAELAIEDFAKDKKVLGKPIELIAADHQGKTDIGASLAREWFDTKQVDMITDLTFSNVALAVQKIADDKGKLALVTGAGSAAITNENCNKSTVHWMYDTYALATGTARALSAQGLKSWFFITADYAFGHALEKDARAIVQAQGGQVLGSVRHPVGTSDMSSYLLQAQASKAQVIGLANSGADTLNTVKQAREFGLGVGANKQVFTPLLALITEIHGMGLQNAQGMFITTGFYWDQDEQTRAFSRRYYERMNKMPSMMQAAVYSAVLHYLKAIQAAGTDEAQPVMAKMKAIEVNDAVVRKGHIRDDGRLVHDMLLVQVKTPAESKAPWDVYQIKTVIPGDQAFQPLSQSRCPLIKK
ncbi:ABC transporter substrate-binding protein [Ottowia pentelensis]|uniref:ABC transporter substrate-binding protein n=1 Tax=Ottowia pentelensis TaxID=511108 RepID=UPI001E12E599|nr:ABC transporter substrate-binding protein [Pseudomonadota bacterium]